MTRKTRTLTLLAALLLPLAVALGLRALNADLTGHAIGVEDAIIGVELPAVEEAWQSTGLTVDLLSTPTFAQQVTANGQDPATIRLRASNNQLRIQELTGDDNHMTEAVDLLVLGGDLRDANIDGEAGTVQVTQANHGTRHTVELRGRYSNPVVILQIATTNGGQPAVAQVFSVGRTAFTFGVIEPSTLGNGAHASEHVHYAVIEAGMYTLPDGRRLVAGTTPAWTLQFDPGEGYTKIVTKDLFDGPVINIARSQGTEGDAPNSIAGVWATEGQSGQGDQNNLKLRFLREQVYTANPAQAKGTIGYVMLGQPGPRGTLIFENDGNPVAIDYEGEINGRCQNLADLGIDDLDAFNQTISLTTRAFGTTSLVLYRDTYCSGGAAVISGSGHAVVEREPRDLWPRDDAGARTGPNGGFGSFRVIRADAATLVGEHCFEAGEVVLSNESSHLVFQADGDLVQYLTNPADRTLVAVWSSDTAGQAIGGTLCTEGDDLDLVIRDAAGQTVWAQETDSTTGSHRVLQLTAACGLRVTDAIDSVGALWQAGEVGEESCWKALPPAILSAMPEYALSFTDLDGDGERELVLLLMYSDGRADLIYDPLGIAHQLHLMGITIDQLFIDTLSPTQRAALEDQTEDARAAEGTGLVDATNNTFESPLTAQYEAVPMNRTAYETSDSGDSPIGGETRVTVSVGHYHYESEPGALGENFEMQAYVARVEYSTHGGAVTYSVTVGETTRTQYVAGDGFAIGGGTDLVTVGVVYGDAEGSYVGFSAGVGQGGGVDVRWGRDDQYGIALACPKLPVGFAIYVSGEDVTWLVDEIGDLAVAGYAETRDAAIHAWSWTASHAASAAQGTKIWFTAAGSDTRAFIDRTGEQTSEIIMTSARSSWRFTVDGFDTAWTSVRDAFSAGLQVMESGADDVASALATAAGAVAGSVTVVAEVADGIWAAVEDTARQAAKTVIRLFKKFKI